MRISDWSPDVCSSDLEVRTGRPLLAVADELDAVQHAEAAHVADDLVPGLQLAQAGPQMLAEVVRLLDQLLRQDDLQHRAPDLRRQWIGQVRGVVGVALLVALLDRKSTRLNSSHQCASRM